MDIATEIWDSQWVKLRDIGVTPTRRNIFKLFKGIDLPIDAKVLDVGCGAGTLAHFWHEQGYDVTGLDISDEALALSSPKGFKRIKGDVGKLPFADNTFDLVYSDGLLEHFTKPEVILQEIWRTSKHYVLTLVPRCTLYNWLCNIVFKPPKEYKKSDEEWLQLHLACNPITTELKKVAFGILFILVNKIR